MLQSNWNFPNGLFNYIQACIFSWLKLLFNFYVKRTAHRQEFGSKFNLTYTIMALLSRTSLISQKLKSWSTVGLWTPKTKNDVMWRHQFHYGFGDNLWYTCTRSNSVLIDWPSDNGNNEGEREIHPQYHINLVDFKNPISFWVRLSALFINNFCYSFHCFIDKCISLYLGHFPFVCF